MVLLLFCGLTYAEHYRVNVENKIDKKELGRQVYISYKKGETVFDFSCKGLCNGLLSAEVQRAPGQREIEMDNDIIKQNPKYIKSESSEKSNGGLKFLDQNEFISATGQVFLIHELLMKYEKVLEGYKGKKNFSMTGSEEYDLKYVLIKSGNTYSIDIYTGPDALNLESDKIEK